ncbi:MAG TPA: CBS domain-containing protein [Azospirillum sp.]|nr:CBS domain-containing protein [Azospirillum sp.]
MKVEDILRGKGTRINMVRVHETVDTALQLMKTDNVGALVVKDVCRTEGNTVVGVISERDVVRGLVDRGPSVLKQPVSALMTADPVTCRPGDPIHHVLRLMDEHAIRHVPVLDGPTLIGVISVRDLIKLQLGEACAAEAWNSPVAAHQ